MSSSPQTPDDALPTLQEAGDVERLAAAVYGRVPRDTGVVQVAAAWLRRPDRLALLRTAAGAPRAAFDTFALGLARARADAILTTGEIVRHEPELRHGLDALEVPGWRLGAALESWRRETLGKAGPPLTLVLSSGRDLDLDHPLFSGPSRTLVFTDRDGVWRLESAAMDRGIEVVAHPAPGPRSAVEFLRTAFGAATVLIEAGSSTSRPLYDEPPVIDELLLSIDRTESLDPRWRGPAFLDLQTLNAYFDASTRPYRVAGDDGPWELLRFVRRF
ncbi:MAG: hypothetical protein AAGC60_06770 [Acidobacteriota bacterium]